MSSFTALCSSAGRGASNSCTAVYTQTLRVAAIELDCVEAISEGDETNTPSSRIGVLPLPASRLRRRSASVDEGNADVADALPRGEVEAGKCSAGTEDLSCSCIITTTTGSLFAMPLPLCEPVSVDEGDGESSAGGI